MTFERRYKPLKFKLFGIKFCEHLPHAPKLLEPAVNIYYFLLVRLTAKVSYFGLRLGFTQETRKKTDIHFLSHYIKDHIQAGEKAGVREAIHYYLIKLRYLPELYYVNSVLSSSEAPKHAEQPKVDLYMLRWGYLLDVQPSFVELIHGTSREIAIDAIDNLY